MLEIRLLNTGIRLGFSFFAVIALVSLNSNSTIIFQGIIACILHEMGHIFFMFLFNTPPKYIVFYGAGIKIIADNSRIISQKKDIIILCAGSFTNYIIAGISLILAGKIDGFFSFAAVNVALGTFNILPYRSFDGGRILETLLSTTSDRTAFFIRKIFSFISVIGLMVLLVALINKSNLSVSLAVTLVYIICSEIFYE